jgi:hypothetical protein
MENCLGQVPLPFLHCVPDLLLSAFLQPTAVLSCTSTSMEVILMMLICLGTHFQANFNETQHPGVSLCSLRSSPQKSGGVGCVELAGPAKLLEYKD